MDRQEATNLFVSVRDPATSSYSSWRARQPGSAHSPAMGSCVSSLWTLPILYSRISFQSKDPGVVQHSALLADTPSRARSVEDSCPGGWTWLEASLSLKTHLQRLSPTPYHYSYAWPCAGFGTRLAGDNITGTQGKDIWARLVTATVMSMGGAGIKAASEGTRLKEAVWLPSTLCNVYKPESAGWWDKAVSFGVTNERQGTDNMIRPWLCPDTDRGTLELCFEPLPYWTCSFFGWQIDFWVS